MYSCTTCRLNSMLCERCCLAMAFIFRKPRTPVKSLTSTCPAPGAHSRLGSPFDPTRTLDGIRTSAAPKLGGFPHQDVDQHFGGHLPGERGCLTCPEWSEIRAP